MKSTSFSYGLKPRRCSASVTKLESALDLLSSIPGFPAMVRFSRRGSSIFATWVHDRDRCSQADCNRGAGPGRGAHQHRRRTPLEAKRPRISRTGTSLGDRPLIVCDALVNSDCHLIAYIHPIPSAVGCTTKTLSSAASWQAARVRAGPKFVRS